MNPISNASYWQTNTFARKADFAIVGAGICGLSTAYFLKLKYPSAVIHVYERSPYPDGASVRNAGFACIGSVGELLADSAHLSLEQQLQLVEERYRGLELMRAVLGDEHIGYEACGGYELFETAEEEEKVFAAIPTYNDLLMPLTGGEPLYERTQIGGKNAVFNTLEGAINSGKMIESLVKKVQSMGVVMRFNSAVSTTADGEQIITNDGKHIEASKVILCTNGYTNTVLDKSFIRPARGYILLTDSLPNLAWKGTFHMHKGYVYFRNIGERLLLGGFRHLDKEAEETLEEKINPTIKTALIELAENFLGLPKPLKIEEEWLGYMGFTDSGLPEIKPINDKTINAGGFNGMGVALGMGFAKKIATYCTS